MGGLETADDLEVASVLETIYLKVDDLETTDDLDAACVPEATYLKVGDLETTSDPEVVLVFVAAADSPASGQKS